jgi:acyl-CoA reductase-like NAD-dependent aldehyde dehydrogenase
MNKQQLYINGEWIETQQYYDLASPYNGEIIAQIPLAEPSHIEASLAGAQKATAIMRGLTALERSDILRKVSDLFEQRLEECALILTKEAAKPLKAARMEIVRTIETYRFAAEEAKRIHGETVPMDAAKGGKGKFGFTKREPLGVIVAITPFNFPYNLAAHKLGPAFAAGNTVVLKPASQTPLSAFMTARFFEEAGLPPGALNVVTGKGGDIGDLLISDSRVKMVTFTGSMEVGLSIKEKVGLKRVTLELGSNSGVIIDSAENLEAVAARCTEGAFSFAGQVCISTQRIYVKEEFYNDFLTYMKEKTEKLVLGDPSSEQTDLSALINSRETDRMEQWIREAEEGGALVVTGGKREGTIFRPTIIANGHSKLSLSCHEAFGPVVLVNSYKEWDEAIKLVNDSEYGLQAGVYTTSVKKAFDAFERLEVGGVIINDIPTFRVDHMPYGGVKNSGIGKEGIKYSTEEMTELKFVAFHL